MKFFSQLKNILLEKLASTPTEEARLWYDDTNKKVKFRDNTATREVIDGDTVQNVDNKNVRYGTIFDPVTNMAKSDTQANLETYAATVTGGALCYANDTGKLFITHDSTLREASGGGSGGYNYNDKNFDSEGDALSTTSSDSSKIIRAHETTNPILGAGSLSFEKTNAANPQDSFLILKTFNLQPAHRATMFEIELGIKIDSGTYNDEDLRVEIFDLDNGKFFNAGDISLNSTLTTRVKFSTYQTAYNATTLQVRLAINNNNTNTYKLIIDGFSSSNWYVGPQRGGVSGAVDVYLGNIPLTTNDTSGNVTISGKGWRKGDFLLLHGRITFTGPGNVASFHIATPYSFDFSKVVGSNIHNTAMWTDTGTAYKSLVPYPHTIPSTGVIRFAEIGAVNVWDSTQAVSGDSIEFKFSVPILGWNSNMVLSEDAGNREIVLEAAFSGGTIANNAYTNLTGSNTTFTVFADTTASFNTTTGLYTFPETGYYDIRIQGANNASTTGAIQFRTLNVQSPYHTGNSGVAFGEQFLQNYHAAKGDSFNFAYYYANASAGTWNSTSFNRISIAKRSSPQTIAQSEKVYGHYTTNTATAISSSYVTIPYEDKVTDSHGAYNPSTGILTAPKSGQLKISASLACGAAIFSTTQRFFLAINKVVGDAIVKQTFRYGNGASIIMGEEVNAKITVVKGEQLYIRALSEVNVAPITSSGAVYSSTLFFSME